MSHPAEHTHQSHRYSPELRHAEGRRITWISVGVNLVLTVMQVVVGWVAHSQSLIADAMHTLSDIIADGFVLYANRKGSEAAGSLALARRPFAIGAGQKGRLVYLGKQGHSVRMQSI